MTAVRLPVPECQSGYTRGQLETLFGDRLDEFWHWFRGQTGSICDGRRYDHEKRQYFPTGCGPHGPVVYQSDVVRFVRGMGPFD